MRKLLALFVMFGFLLVISCEGPIETITSENATDMPSPKKPDYGTIAKGDILYPAVHYFAGDVIPTGSNDFGYNYNSHLFKGYYVNYYFGDLGLPPYTGNDDEYLTDNPRAANYWFWKYRTDIISLKWNDMWLANSDKNNDGKLDIHYGYASYIGSGAWEIYKVNGINDDGDKYNYMCKIIAVPSDAVLKDGIWYNSDDIEIGPDTWVEWGQFATIQEVTTGSKPDGIKTCFAGLGKYK